MRQALGIAVLLLALAACGDDPSAERISTSDASTTTTSAPETTTTTAPSTTTSAVATTTTAAPTTTAPLPSITGKWNVVTIRDGSESLTPELDLSVTVLDERSYRMYDGCNTGGGTYVRTATVIEFTGSGGSTMRGCLSTDEETQARAERETRLFVTVITNNGTRWSLSDDVLRLSRGSTELVLHRA